MADFYESMRQTAEQLLSPTSTGGLGQGRIEIIRTTTTPGANPWEPPATETTTERLDGAVKGISKQLIGTEVGGTIIVASDREAVCTVPKQPYTAGDVLSVDGVPVMVLAVQNIPAAGIASAVRFIIRGA